MPKDIPQPVNPPTGAQEQKSQHKGPQEPLSGSKRVKQENHSRHNNGEG
ncbi:small acid-soluble spore protein P [Paenibacillus flagellatus]|uniref:Small acid-soluble spore protein P n=1 Tax=Paenibacillus flagellatus TaxID=2211139 RepID=A0A2V5KQV1_9BACL|nr:small acid-soluble spore protein P [Paenibacillus flagellatus]PYI51106.1 small acid-soluble spore protein P [Paenibacillus flagellatus]